MKKIIIIVGCTIGLIIVLFFTAQHWLGEKVRKKIEDKVAELSQNTYQIEIKKARVRLSEQSVFLSGISIRNNTNASHPSDNHSQLNGAIQEINLKGIHISSNGGEKSLSLDELEVIAPTLSLSGENIRFFGGTGNTNNIKSFRISHINLQAGKLTYKKWEKTDTANYTLSGLQLNAKELFIHPDQQPLKEKIAVGSFRTSVDQFRYIAPGGDSRLICDSIFLSTDNQLLSIGKTQLIPRYPKDQFAYKAKTHTDWTAVEAGKITCSRFDARELLFDKVFRADSIHLQYATIASYKNRKVAHPQRVKPIFHIGLHRLPVKIDVPRASLHNIDITYEELTANGLTPATIHFNDIRGECYNLSNIPRIPEQKIQLIAFGKLMNSGEVQADFHFPVNDINAPVVIKGSLGPMELSSLNGTIQPLANASIKSGHLNWLEFTLSGDSIRSTVKMKMLYNKLAIELWKESEQHLKERTFLSDLVNFFVIKEENPDRKGLRNGSGETERDPYRSQFNYLWKSLLPGIKKSIL